MIILINSRNSKAYESQSARVETVWEISYRFHSKRQGIQSPSPRDHSPNNSSGLKYFLSQTRQTSCLRKTAPHLQLLDSRVEEQEAISLPFIIFWSGHIPPSLKCNAALKMNSFSVPHIGYPTAYSAIQWKKTGLPMTTIHPRRGEGFNDVSHNKNEVTSEEKGCYKEQAHRAQ